MIGMEEALGLKERLLSLLDEDASNQERLVERLDGIRGESGVEAHSALMLILTGQGFEEAEARRHWEAIVHHRSAMSERVGRDIGLRVAAFDYFVNVNRRSTQPRVIDLHISDPIAPGSVSDPLTGLANDRMFRMSLQSEVRRARRYGPGFVVARLDLDGLQEANERYGSLLVDSLVRETAMVIRNKVRDIDLAARLGSGDFALILPETDRMGGYVVCERIRGAVERFFAQREAGGRPVDLTISGGIAKSPEDGAGPEDLMQRALEALYIAKSRGKNSVAVFFQERRHYLRFDAHGRGLQIRAIPDATVPDPETEAATTNISRGGMLFESVRPYEVGQELLLDLCEPDGTEAIRVRVRVVRVEDLYPGMEVTKYDIGVVFHFDWENEEQEFLAFFERWSRPGRRE